MPLIESFKAAMPPAVKTLLKSGRAYWQGHRSPRSVFTAIYANKLWGGSEEALFSGSGSRGSVASAYVDCVRSFIEARGIRTVVDLGCGDFYIGHQIAKACDSYIGVDVVPMVVDRLVEKYANERIRFTCLDITKDRLPSGELCLIRQVLQHLSNAQIQRALRNLSRYSQVIVTEHYPPDDGVTARNVDKMPGADTRLSVGSAVYLSDPPYDLANLELLLEVPLPADRDRAVPVWKTGVLRSYLWRPGLSGRGG